MEASHSNYLHNFSFLAVAKFFERTAYYAMMTYLVIYISDAYDGAGWSSGESRTLYATFTGLVVILQIAGGLLSDFVMGTRRVLLLGSLSALTGYLMLALGADQSLYAAVCLIAFGSGCIKPSYWGLLGQIFSNHKNKLDSVSLLTIPLANVGAMVSGLSVIIVVQADSLTAAFLLAFVAQLLSVIFILITYKKLPQVSFQKSTLQADSSQSPNSGKWVRFILVTLVLLDILNLFRHELPTLDVEAMMFSSFLSTWLIPLGLIIYSAWCWFRPSSSYTKWLVGLVLYLVTIGLSRVFAFPELEIINTLLYSYIIVMSLAGVLFHSISMSIVLQNGNPRYIATTAAALTVIPSAALVLVGSLASMMGL